MTTAPRAERLRWLPAVHACLADPPPAVRERGAGERLVRAALETALGEVRRAVDAEPDRFGGPDEVVEAVGRAWAAALDRLLRPGLAPLVNATGVVVHTNLGRAPLAEAALAAAREAGGRYTPLEYDLEAGRRGSRYDHARRLLRLVTGAEDAVVVNNNAAALLVAVDTLAGGRDVVVSRGELVEIGGGFRIHEILARSRARVVEVGATNKTRAGDYLQAIADGDVGAIVKVHRSNFRMAGFVEEVGLAELVELGNREGVPVVFDQGTGVLEPLGGWPDEPTLRSAVEAGAALATASGDKLLGGPQAGIVAGEADSIARVRANPLLRALRVDKATLAALEATLRGHLEGAGGIPALAMLGADPDRLRELAEALVARLGEAAREAAEVVPHAGRAGGGTLPERDLPGWAVRIAPASMSAAALERALRGGEPAIVARVEEDAVLVDVRTLLAGEDEIVARRLDEILGTAGREGAS